MLATVKALITEVNSSYIQVYESKQMNNIVADTQNYSNTYVLIEEFQEGKLISSSSTGRLYVGKVRLIVYKFTELENNAEARQVVRDEILNSFVIPLQSELKKNSLNKSDVQLYFPPVPEFDANETAVYCEFELTKRLC